MQLTVADKHLINWSCLNSCFTFTFTLTVNRIA